MECWFDGLMIEIAITLPRMASGPRGELYCAGVKGVLRHILLQNHRSDTGTLLRHYTDHHVGELSTVVDFGRKTP
jgi:hypothetical protein